MYFQKCFFGILVSILLLCGCTDLRAKRSLARATKLAHDKVILLQNAVRSENFFDLQTLNKIFHKKALEKNITAEEKMRAFYKIDPDIQISLFGELLKIACPEIGLIELKDNCYFVKKITRKQYFECIEGIVVPKKNDFFKEYFFFKANLVDCKIDLEKSTYGSKLLLEYLSILPSGKIANPQYEKQLLLRINGH